MEFAKIYFAFANFSMWLSSSPCGFQRALGFAHLYLLVDFPVSCFLCFSFFALCCELSVHAHLLHFVSASLKFLSSSSHHLRYYGFLPLQEPILRSRCLFSTLGFSAFHDEEPEVSLLLSVGSGLLCVRSSSSTPIIAKIFTECYFSSLGTA